MHELSLADDVLRIVIGQLREADLASVKVVRVAIGEMMMVEKDTFTFAFDALKEDTPLKDSRIEIVNIPPKAVCGKCGASFQPEKFYPLCPQCGGQDYSIVEGNSMFVKEVEVD